MSCSYLGNQYQLGFTYLNTYFTHGDSWSTLNVIFLAIITVEWQLLYPPAIFFYTFIRCYKCSNLSSIFIIILFKKYLHPKVSGRSPWPTGVNAIAFISWCSSRYLYLRPRACFVAVSMLIYVVRLSVWRIFFYSRGLFTYMKSTSSVAVIVTRKISMARRHGTLTRKRHTLDMFFT